MLVGFLYTLFVFLCFFIILIVLLQRSKGSLGLSGGNTQALFGGSGGQDFFQRMTWGCIAAFMIGSLLLAIVKNRSVNQSRFIDQAMASYVPQQVSQPQSVDDGSGAQQAGEQA